MSCKQLKGPIENIEGLLLKGVGCGNALHAILDLVDVGVGGFACKVPSHHLHCEDNNELL
jgi:hypothetical protein